MRSFLEDAAAFHQSWRGWLAALLDLIIAVELFALGVSVLGGLDLGWVSATEAAKPAVLLILFIPLRLVVEAVSPLSVALDRVKSITARLVSEVAWPRGMTGAFRDVLFVLLITRLGTFAVAFFCNLLFPVFRTRPFEMPFAWQKAAEVFAAWDSGWYFDIARRGYSYNPDGQSSIAFFPLYPLIMRAVAFPFGMTDRAIWTAGVLVSTCALIGALVALHRLTESLSDEETARRTVTYVAAFPFSFFFSLVYAESLFLLLSVLAVLAAYRSRWWAAGVCGGLAALVRPNGVLVGIPLLLLALRNRPGSVELLRRCAALGLVPLGLVAFCAYNFILTGNALAWLDAQRHWHYSLGDAPWRQLVKMIAALERHGPYDMFFTSRLMPYQVIHGSIAFLFLALTPLVFKRLGIPLGAYVLAGLLVPLSGSDPQGLGRYAAVLFPVFIAVSSFRSQRLHEAILVTSSLFLALCVGLFVTWRPIF